MSLSTWLKKTKIDTSCITWEQWAKVRNYLINAGEISATDPRWMLPSEMRDYIERFCPSDDETELLDTYRGTAADYRQMILEHAKFIRQTHPAED